MSEIIIDAPVTGPIAPEDEGAGTNKGVPQDIQPDKPGESSQRVNADEGVTEPRGKEGETGGNKGEGKDSLTEQASEILEIAGLDMTELATEYTRDGALSAESYKELEENGFPKAVVDAYIRGVKAEHAEVSELADGEVKELYTLAGGEENYGKMMNWAGDIFSNEEKEAYNSAVTGGNKHVAAFAIRGLIARYEQEYGHDPHLLGGGSAAKSDGSKFASKADMVEAMSDKRYGRDEHYTKEVERKLLNSNIMRPKGN